MLKHAVLLGQNVGVPIRLAGVGHGRQFQRRGIVADDASDVVLVAELPRAALVACEEFFRRLVAQLHVVDAGRHAGVVHRLDKPVLEGVIVDQAAVADRAIQDFQIRTIGDPRGSHSERG